jgi:hypothetical protein
MKTQDYHTSITVSATPQEVYKGINQVSQWWTECIEGSSQKLNDEFTVRFGDVHVSTQKLVELVPGQKVVWLVTDSHLNFVEDEHEWTNTRISFDISKQGDKTKIQFTHLGLAPGIECYKSCVPAWEYYVTESLFKLLAEGKGMPELKAK